MNERIRELAQQAGMYVDLGGNSWPKSMSAEECEAAYKKFAELIVRECIEKVELRKKFAIEDEHIMELAFDLLVYDLESHFGVEE